MIDADDMRIIRKEIQKQVQIILSGQSGGGDVFKETIESMLPGMDNITDRPLMHPYGFSSIAPKGTIQVTARQGEHPGNRVVLGHRDSGQPTDLGIGESAIYSKSGYSVRVVAGQIELGKGGTWEPAVLGDSLNKVLTAILDAIIKHTHMGNLGFPTAPPDNAATFTAIENEQLKTILAKDGGAY